MERVRLLALRVERRMPTVGRVVHEGLDWVVASPRMSAEKKAASSGT